MQSPGSDVSRDKYAEFFLFELSCYSFAVRLRHVTVKAFRFQANIFQVPYEFFGRSFSVAKNQREVPLLFEKFSEKAESLFSGYFIVCLLEIFGFHGRFERYLHGILKVFLYQSRYFFRYGRAEKHCLSFSGDIFEYAFDIINKTHIKHSVGFVEHEILQFVEFYGFSVHDVEQSAGSSDYDVRAAQLENLFIDGNPSINGADADFSVCELHELSANLNAEFSCRHEYERFNSRLFLIEGFNYWYGETESFP